MGDRSRNWCKHYNGTVNPECRAGVKYEEVRKDFGTPKFSLPCFRAGHEFNQGGATCDKCEFRTAEEVAAEEAETKARLGRMGMIRKAIVAACGGPWKKGMKGSAGAIECPACKTGTVSFTRSGYNGHVHARCSTANCAAWME